MFSADDERQSVESILGTGFYDHQLLGMGDLDSVSGPPVWWGGPLNVERLAAGSVSLVCAALDALAGAELKLASSTPSIGAAFGSSSHLRIEGQRTQGFAQYSGFYRCMDGWIRTHANYPHHERALLTALGMASASGIEDVLRHLGAREAQERIVSAGGIAAVVRSRQQWLNSAEGSESGRGPWAQFSLREASSTSSWAYGQRTEMPLQGLKILDLTRVIAGPTASRTLAAFGAQVLRLDAPQLPELAWQHVDTGFGKRSTLLDLKSAPGQARLHELLGEADALILGYRPGALASAGLGLDELRERYPDLIVAELSAWGFEGPWAQRRGFDSIVQAATGISQACSDAGHRPGALPVQALDHATGYGLAAAVIALVRARRVQRQTGSVRFSLARTADALFAFDAPHPPVQSLGEVQLRRMSSSYGELEYVGPPFSVAGRALDFAKPPPVYGQDEPVWN